MQSYLTPFEFGTILLLLCHPALWLFIMCVGLVLTLSNVRLFPHLLRRSTFLNAREYQNPLCILKKQIDIFVVLPCAVHVSLTLALCSLAHRPFLNPDFSTAVLYTLYESSFLYNSQEGHIFMKK